MAPNPEDNRGGQPPPGDDPIIINRRIQELEREVQEQKKDDSNYKDRQLRFNKWLTVATIGLLFTSVIGIGISIIQSMTAKTAANAATGAADTASASLEESKNSFRLDQRAWIGVAQLRLNDVPTANMPVEFIAEIQNTGSTPGLNAIISKYLSPDRPTSIDVIDAPQTGDPHYAVIAPSAGTRYFPSISPYPTEGGIHPLEVDILKGGKRMYLYGTIRYDDIFERQHLTRFCGVYVYTIHPTYLLWCDEKDYNYIE